ncbi:hypothetical protein Dimus_036819, partial [Dionaea muscipula]
IEKELSSGLSAEYTFSDDEEVDETGSLHTIDEEDDEEELDETSNQSEDDVQEEREQEHIHQDLVDNLIPDEEETLITLSKPLANLISSFSHSTSSLQPHLEMGQSSTVAFENSVEPDLDASMDARPRAHPNLDSNCRRQVKKVWIPKGHAAASNLNVTHVEQEIADRAGIHSAQHRDGGQEAHIHDAEQLHHHQLDENLDVGYPDRDDNHRVEDDLTCPLPQSSPTTNMMSRPYADGHDVMPCFVPSQ